MGKNTVAPLRTRTGQQPVFWATLYNQRRSSTMLRWCGVSLQQQFVELCAASCASHTLNFNQLRHVALVDDGSFHCLHVLFHGVVQAMQQFAHAGHRNAERLNKQQQLRWFQVDQSCRQNTISGPSHDLSSNSTQQ